MRPLSNGPLFAVAFALSIAAATNACSAEATSHDRTSVPGAMTADGGPDGDATTVADPDDGRTASVSACFSACQNAGYACQAKVNGTRTSTSVEMAPATNGCAGTLAEGQRELDITIDCLSGKVCLAEASGAGAPTCEKGLFNAFSFSYPVAAGGAPNVCSRVN